MTTPPEPEINNGEDPEIRALRAIAATMAELDPVAAERVAHWVFDRYTIPTNGARP